MQQIIECVPNFSEGQNLDTIRQITDEIQSMAGVRLLNVDPGHGANRTVVTFIGEADKVTEAAFRAVRKAAELIDMSGQKGTHPRMGATDVLPLIPISGISLEECAQLARNLAKRISEELSIPCYCYEAAAFRPEFQNLADCRSGEYEGLAKRMGTEKGPDFGNREFDDRVRRAGATAVGARNFLIAVNFNLNSKSAQIAGEIARDVRTKGRKIIGADGEPTVQKGSLKSAKAIGWFIDEYDIAQVSMNITDIKLTPLHEAYEQVCLAAEKRGLRVTGTEIVGLVPKDSLIEAGLYFLRKQNLPTDIPEEEIIRTAISSMGLDELRPFTVKEKVLE